MPSRGGVAVRFRRGTGPAALAAALVVALTAVPSAAPRRAAAPTRLTVYLVRGELVTPVRRAVPHTVGVARAALLALLRGPSAAERRAGVGSAIPAGTALRGVTVAGGVATVDLGRRFETGGGSVSMQLRVAQVVYTATQFPTVRRVAFELDGRPVVAIGGEGVIVSPPAGRGAFEAQTPAILVEQPLPGDTVGPRVVVRGTANVFEAWLVVELRSGSGRVLVRRNVLATAGTGTRGTYASVLRAPAGASRLHVVVYARSPKNGSPIDRVTVPVVLRR